MATRRQLPRFDRDLSSAIDRAVAQAEAAEASGDQEAATAWRSLLADLEQRIPKRRRR
jgi:hypothetical protein